MVGVRNACLGVGTLALIGALALFAMGYTNYAYFVLVLVPLCGIGAIVSMPSRVRRGRERRDDGTPTGGRPMSSG